MDILFTYFLIFSELIFLNYMLINVKKINLHLNYNKNGIFKIFVYVMLFYLCLKNDMQQFIFLKNKVNRNCKVQAY